MRRAVLVVLVATFFVGAGLLVPAQAVASQVQVTRTSGTPTSGIPLRLVVKVGNGVSGQKVWLERKVGRAWRPALKRTLGPSKQVVLTSPLRLGSPRFRVHVFAKGNRKQALRYVTVAVRPRVSPAPYAGEAFALSGRLPANGARPVKLQRKNGSRWVVVASKAASRAGAVSFSRPGTSTSLVFRFYAPHKGRLRAFASYPVRVTPAERNRLLSITPGGHDGNDTTQEVDISGDGRFVVFQSWANDLAAGDTNNLADIYLRDVVAGTTRLITRGVGGASTNAGSQDPRISDDGRYVTFGSGASNLVPVDGNGTVEDVFRYDRITGAMVLVSHDNAGGAANGASSHPTISADGSRIAFSSPATDLTSQVDDNSAADVFLWSAASDTTVRISKPASNATNLGGGNNQQISADGKWIAFSSSSDDIAGASAATQSTFLRNVDAGTTARVSTSTCTSGFSWPFGVSNGGTHVGFYSNCPDVLPGDGLGYYDVFSKAMGSGQVTLVSHTPAHGFGNGSSYGPVDMTADGGKIVFNSNASNLVAGDGNGSIEDVFLWLRSTGAVTLVSRGRGLATSADAGNDLPRISANGRYVVWISEAQNLVAAGVDTDNEPDAYLRDLR